MPVGKKSLRINEEIRAREVRLIDAEGEQVGVVGFLDALARANTAGLDLVEISPNAIPPVCRIMDYGKHVYEESKQKSAAKKKQVRTQLKEIKFRPNTDQGDYDVKMRNIKRFLEQANKVKVTLRFRGREMSHQQLGMELLKRVVADIEEAGLGTVDSMPKMEGRQMVMVLSPKKVSAKV